MKDQACAQSARCFTSLAKSSLKNPGLNPKHFGWKGRLTDFPSAMQIWHTNFQVYLYVCCRVEHQSAFRSWAQTNMLRLVAIYFNCIIVGPPGGKPPVRVSMKHRIMIEIAGRLVHFKRVHIRCVRCLVSGGCACTFTASGGYEKHLTG